MEKLSELFYEIVCPWRSFQYLELASIVSCSLICLSVLIILISCKIYYYNNIFFNSYKFFRVVVYGCCPLISLSMSLLFKWYISGFVFFVILVFCFSSSKNNEFMTKNKFILLCTMCIFIPNILLVILAFLGLPYMII